MRKAILLFFCLTFGGAASAQKHLATPSFRTCTKFIECESGTKNLSAGELAELQKLLRAVLPGMTEAEISKIYVFKPNSITPPIEGTGLLKGTKISKGIWYTTAKQSSGLDPTIDVLFANGKAISFTWWIDGCCAREVTAVFLAE
jgi:hypothetical protein